MNVKSRNNIQVHGRGATTIVLSHGFGSNQHMWQHMLPLLTDQYRVVTFDLVGSGNSDTNAYNRVKYGTLDGYASDLLEILDDVGPAPCVYIGHSVGGMIGLLAANRQPDKFAAQIMVGPSPCYLNDGDYQGGFGRDDIDELLDAMDSNFLGWSSNMAPTLMGTANGPELANELAQAFSSCDPDIARHFAKVTYFSDHRPDLPRNTTPALILQSTEDPVVPVAVGEWLHAHLPGSVLNVIQNTGHYLHMSMPHETMDAITAFLQRQARPAGSAHG